MTKSSAEPQNVLVEAPPSVPFEDTGNPSKDFEVTKPVDVSRLQAEIAEALGHQVQVVVAHQDLDQPISEDAPAKIYVSADSEFDGRKVRGVITSHDGSPTKEETDLADLLESFESGKNLTLSDLNTVVRKRLFG